MRQALVLGIIGVALTALFGYHRIYAPQQDQVRLIHEQTTQERAAQDMRAEALDLIQQLEAYRRRLPSEPDPAWLVREAVALGERAGIQFTSIRQQSTRASSEASEFLHLGVDLEFNATYHEIGTFLDLFERSRYFIRAERVQMVRQADATGPPNVSLALSTVYVPVPVEGFTN